MHGYMELGDSANIPPASAAVVVIVVVDIVDDAVCDVVIVDVDVDNNPAADNGGAVVDDTGENANVGDVMRDGGVIAGGPALGKLRSVIG
jgi:hypothetical protein